MLTATALATLLKTHRLRLTKRLGQHHLVDPRAIERIIDCCQLSSQDTVVEIGAGLGALTEGLVERGGRVIAVEVDRRVCDLLTERMRPWANVQVVCQDILAFDWSRVGSVVVVGAIPYSITSPILIALCEHRRAIRRAILIMQSEVADRLLARPGTKAYGRLSLLAQYHWDIRSRAPLPRGAFFPPPDVESTCVEWVARESPPVQVAREEALFALIKAAFAQRRKSLVNCLRAALPKEQRAICEGVVQAVGLSRSIRGEALSLAQFAELSNACERANITFPIRHKK